MKKSSLALALALAASLTSHRATASAPSPSYTVTDLGTLGGVSSEVFYSSGQNINASGHVIGTSRIGQGSHAFLYTEADGMLDLGTLGGPSSFATGLNNHDQVVGESTTTSGE